MAHSSGLTGPLAKKTKRFEPDNVRLVVIIIIIASSPHRDGRKRH